MIIADPSAVQDIVEGAQTLVNRLSSVLGKVDLLLEENRPAITRSIQRLDEFTETISQNTEGLGRFLNSVSDTSGNLASLVSRIEAFVENLDQLVKSTDGDAINKTLSNIRALSATLLQSGESINAIVSKADSAASDIQQFSSRLSKSLEAINAIARSINPADVKRTVSAVTEFSESLSATRVLVDDVLVGARGTIDNLDKFTATLNEASPDIKVISTSASDIAQRIASIGERVKSMSHSRMVSSLPAL